MKYNTLFSVFILLLFENLERECLMAQLCLRCISWWKKKGGVGSLVGSPSKAAHNKAITTKLHWRGETLRKVEKGTQQILHQRNNQTKLSKKQLGETENWPKSCKKLRRVFSNKPTDTGLMTLESWYFNLGLHPSSPQFHQCSRSTRSGHTAKPNSSSEPEKTDLIWNEYGKYPMPPHNGKE